MGQEKKPENENAIIIETKLFGSDLTPEQETNYKNFKSQFSKIKGAKIKLMLLSIKDYNDKEGPIYLTKQKDGQKY